MKYSVCLVPMFMQVPKVTFLKYGCSNFIENIFYNIQGHFNKQDIPMIEEVILYNIVFIDSERLNQQDYQMNIQC